MFLQNVGKKLRAAILVPMLNDGHAGKPEQQLYGSGDASVEVGRDELRMRAQLVARRVPHPAAVRTGKGALPKRKHARGKHEKQ